MTWILYCSFDVFVVGQLLRVHIAGSRDPQCQTPKKNLVHVPVRCGPRALFVGTEMEHNSRMNQAKLVLCQLFNAHWTQFPPLLPFFNDFRYITSYCSEVCTSDHRNRAIQVSTTRTMSPVATPTMVGSDRNRWIRWGRVWRTTKPGRA